MILLKKLFVFGGRSELSDQQVGRCSLELGLTVERKDTLGGAESDLLEYEVPGRDGTVFVPRNRRKNVTVVYETYLKAPGKRDIPQYVGDIKRWLLAEPGKYRKLEDSYDPDHYRWAVYRGGFNAEEVIRGYTRQAIAFSCLPYRYRKVGDRELHVNQGQSIVLYNDTGFEALPLIQVELSTGTIANVTVRYGASGGESVIVTNIPKDVSRVLLWSENKELQLFSTSGEERFAAIDRFPVLYPGKNTLTVVGGRVTGAAIRPLWREL